MISPVSHNTSAAGESERRVSILVLFLDCVFADELQVLELIPVKGFKVETAPTGGEATEGEMEVAFSHTFAKPPKNHILSRCVWPYGWSAAPPATAS